LPGLVFVSSRYEDSILRPLPTRSQVDLDAMKKTRRESVKSVPERRWIKGLKKLEKIEPFMEGKGKKRRESSVLGMISSTYGENKKS